MTTKKAMARREEAALAMYTGGATLADIARELNISYAGARLVVNRAMRSAFPPAENLEEWRHEKIAQLEALIDRLWPNAADEKTAQAIIRAIDKQADLIGLARYSASETTVTIEHVRTYREQIADRLEVVKGELVQPHEQQSASSLL